MSLFKVLLSLFVIWLGLYGLVGSLARLYEARSQERERKQRRTLDLQLAATARRERLLRQMAEAEAGGLPEAMNEELQAGLEDGLRAWAQEVARGEAGVRVVGRRRLRAPDRNGGAQPFAAAEEDPQDDQ